MTTHDRTTHGDHARDPKPRLIVLGGGGHAAVVIDAARAAGWGIAGYLDDAAPTDSVAPPPGVTLLGVVDELPLALTALGGRLSAHAAAGDPGLRRSWLSLIDAVAGEHGSVDAATVIHPSAVVAPSAIVADGVFIGPGAIVNARARLERGAIINSGAVVEHDCSIGAFSHIAPGAVLAGSVSVGANALVGISAAVNPGVSIGDDVVLGAGAVAVSDIASGARAIGVPARSERL